MWLALALACAGGAPAPLAPPPAPVPVTGTPAHLACVESCVTQRQMAAEAIEAIRARCSADCDAAGDPATLP